MAVTRLANLAVKVSDLDAALAALGAADPRLLSLVAATGRPPLRRRPDGFAGLAATIVAQQLCASHDIPLTNSPPTKPASRPAGTPTMPVRL